MVKGLSIRHADKVFFVFFVFGVEMARYSLYVHNMNNYNDTVSRFTAPVFGVPTIGDNAMYDNKLSADFLDESRDYITVYSSLDFFPFSDGETAKVSVYRQEYEDGVAVDYFRNVRESVVIPVETLREFAKKILAELGDA